MKADGAQRIDAAIRAASSRGTPALVAFVTAGFPDRKHFRALLAQVESAADVVEVGVPFSDPMADGVTIQRSSEAALHDGVTLEWILKELAATAPHRVPILLMSYLNPLMAFGFRRLASRCQAAGVCGFIVPDMPFEESTEFRAEAEPLGLAVVQMVTPVTPPDRLARLAAGSRGFVYAVTSTGTTGRSGGTMADLDSYLASIRAATKTPVCAGFGIRSAAQIRALRGKVDGVIVGSALVEVVEKGESPAAWLKALRS